MTINKNSFIIEGKKYPRKTIEMFFRIYCRECEKCSSNIKNICKKILKKE